MLNCTVQTVTNDSLSIFVNEYKPSTAKED